MSNATSSKDEDMQNKMPAWTVSEIIQNAGRLGIPHFQRGLVWGSDAVGALLE